MRSPYHTAPFEAETECYTPTIRFRHPTVDSLSRKVQRGIQVVELPSDT